MTAPTRAPAAPVPPVQDFAYQSLPGRVVFGAGSSARTGAEVQALGCSRALVLSTPNQADQAETLRDQLGELAAGTFTGAAMHTPVEVTGEAIARLRSVGADCTVAIGGGSTIGLGKAIAARTGVPQVVLPTTYAGSEVTPVLGQTEDGRKTTHRSLDVLPETVIYDVDLTLSLPPSLSASSGLNSMAHAVEALWAQEANPITSLMAGEALRALAGALPRIMEVPHDRPARSSALYGAWLSGTCLAAVGMALHHKLCHVLGGTFGLPHAETHAVVLPHVVAFNAPAAGAAVESVAAALGVRDAAPGLRDLVLGLGLPGSLRELGMPEDGIEIAADRAVQDPYWNPRPVTRASVETLLADAWNGAAPRSWPI